MKLDELGRVGERVTESNVPILADRERIIGFRELEYTVTRGSLFKKTVLPWRKGWVYQTSQRLICLDEGWEGTGEARRKRMHEIPFSETQRVEHKRREVLVHIESEGGKAVAAFKPFGGAARLLDWLLTEKERRKDIAKGRAESPYLKSRSDEE